MKQIIELNKNEIASIIADKYGVGEEKVTVVGEPVWKSYGPNEQKVYEVVARLTFDEQQYDYTKNKNDGDVQHVFHQFTAE